MFDSLRLWLGLDRESVLVRRLRGRDAQAAKDASEELARLPCSDAIIMALESSPWSTVGIEALGLIDDPRAAAALVRKLTGNRDERDDACIALGHPHHEAAVPELEHLALRDSDYHVVAAAMKALAGIGTPGAVSALERFRNQPARQLRYHETDEDFTLVSSDRLGQSATAARDPFASR